MLSNSARNGLESSEYVSVDDRHVNAPRGSSIVEITLGLQNSEYSTRDGPELAKRASVYDRHVNALEGLVTMETTPGPQSIE